MIARQDAEEVGAILCKRSAYATPYVVGVIRWLCTRQQRIARVKRRVVSPGTDFAVQLACPWFGENLDTSVTKAIKLRGERILVDANLADGRLGRKLTSAEPVNVDLASTRTRCGACQRLQI